MVVNLFKKIFFIIYLYFFLIKNFIQIYNSILKFLSTWKYPFEMVVENVGKFQTKISFFLHPILWRIILGGAFPQQPFSRKLWPIGRFPPSVVQQTILRSSQFILSGPHVQWLIPVNFEHWYGTFNKLVYMCHMLKGSYLKVSMTNVKRGITFFKT